MKYLKVFDTTAEYNAFKLTENFILPNVSCTLDDLTVVYYNPYVATPSNIHNGYYYIDFNLPSGTKWATMNVGATSITDYGNYYMYGKGSIVYNNSDSEYDGKMNPLAKSADTAAQVMGGEWHMPTSTQINELIANTTYTWETDFNGSGISGGKFASKTDSTKYIFMPAAGYKQYNSVHNLSSTGYYLSSTPNGSGNVVNGLSFRSGANYITSMIYRSYGCSVRGVLG